MSSGPSISVITPSYNQGRFIEQTILSLRGQSYRQFEHIIVDAGSTDETLDILRKYQGSYDMTWFSEPDGGMYEGVNKGLRRASGQILAYLNSDDLYLPWTLEVVADHFSRNGHTDLLYGDVVFLDDATQTFELTFCPPFNLSWAIHIGGLYQPTVFWRRRAYEKVGGFDETLKFVGDYEYWLRIASQSTVERLSEFLAVDRLQSQAKRFVHRNLLDAELIRVRDTYASSHSSRMRRAFYRSYGFFWVRYFMGRFLMERARPTRRGGELWSHLLGVRDLQLPSLGRLLKRALPFVGKTQGPWLVSNLPLAERKE